MNLNMIMGIYLFLVRFVAVIILLNFYMKSRSKKNKNFFIAMLIYSISAIFSVITDYNSIFYYLAGAFAILGTLLIFMSILDLIYQFKSKFKYIVVCLIFTLSIIELLLSNDISKIVVLGTQIIIIIASLTAVIVRQRKFRERLGSSFKWLLTSLITGNLVIGVHLLNLFNGVNFEYMPSMLTFIASLVITVFFVQLEYISQNRVIQESNRQLTEDAREIEKAKNEQNAMIENISDVIAILDEKAIVKYVSPNIERFFGWKPEELIGEHSFNYIKLDNGINIDENFKELLKNHGTPRSMETEYLCKDGSYKTVNMTVNNLLNNPDIKGVLINYRDVSKQKNLEKEKLKMEVFVRNQQSLESIGVLAAGMAHEINNPINGIMNYAQLIMDMPETNVEIVEFSREIVSETERVAKLVKHLLRFAHQDDEEFHIANLEEIISGTLPLIKTVLKRDQINLQVYISSNLPDIRCKSHQIQQILMNLLTNARDSLNERYPEYNDDKICRVTCKVIDNDSKQMIRIMVEDHGFGIKQSIQNKIFDPFFTTKPRDKGTGLGLSISYGIAKEHNGKLGFESVENEYTRFFLDLPVD